MYLTLLVLTEIMGGILRYPAKLDQFLVNQLKLLISINKHKNQMWSLKAQLLGYFGPVSSDSCSLILYCKIFHHMLILYSTVI